MKSIIIIGGGQAAAQAIMSLRAKSLADAGYDGDIILIGEEAVLPYQRPPLSKAYLKGEFEEHRLYFRPQAWYDENNVTLMLGQRVQKINRDKKVVVLTDNREIAYDKVIIATGTRPRPLPNNVYDPNFNNKNINNENINDQPSFSDKNAPAIFSLRTIEDVNKIRTRMEFSRKLLIIGAGYIGLEVAAVARQMGLDVCVVEMADRVLARVTSPIMSQFYEDVHRKAGVKVFTNSSVTSLKNKIEGKVRTVEASFADGRNDFFDLVLVGIGIIPNDDLASEAGLKCDNGIIVDRDGGTDDPDIYAAGDCAIRPYVHHQGRGRLESVHNAIEQGKLSAASILKRPRPPEDCPWFWSDQYDLKLQIAGLSQGYDQYVVRGNIEQKKFAVFYLKEGILIAVDAVNAAPEFIMAKKMIIGKVKPNVGRLQDINISMKEIAKDNASE